MYKTYELNDINFLIKELKNNKLKTLLAEKNKGVLVETLSKNSNFKNKIYIYGEKETLSIQIFNVGYNHFKEEDLTCSLSDARYQACKTLFDKWNNLGYNKNYSKDPFFSMLFQDYLKKIDYFNSDYVIVITD